jgi:hypothetical protein
MTLRLSRASDIVSPHAGRFKTRRVRKGPPKGVTEDLTLKGSGRGESIPRVWPPQDIPTFEQIRAALYSAERASVSAADCITSRGQQAMEEVRERQQRVLYGSPKPRRFPRCRRPPPQRVGGTYSTEPATVPLLHLAGNSMQLATHPPLSYRRLVGKEAAATTAKTVPGRPASVDTSVGGTECPLGSVVACMSYTRVRGKPCLKVS